MKFKNYDNCNFVATRYTSNGNLALVIMHCSDMVAVCSVNTNERVDDGRIAIKDYSENKGMVDFLKGEGIIEGDPIYTIPSGWVEIPVYALTDKGLSLWELEKLSAK